MCIAQFLPFVNERGLERAVKFFSQIPQRSVSDFVHGNPALNIRPLATESKGAENKKPGGFSAGCNPNKNLAR